ncbi:OmpA family protein [Thermodesulfobacteriota bacterium]
MGPFGGGRLYRVLIACVITAGIALAPFPAAADDCKRIQNILILFDASGFMKDKGRYEFFMKNMGFFDQAMPLTADGFFNVGLRYYGFKVGMGCESTESILGIQPWDRERFLNAFPKHLSYGVSALSAGLRAAADEVSQAEGKSIIIVIGGGMESCTADPIKTADQIAQNNPDLEIHTFQVADYQEGTFFLKGIAEKCGGTYNNLRQMGSQAGWHAWMKRYLVQPCATPNTQAKEAVTGVGPVVFDYNSFSVRSNDPAIDSRNLAALDLVGKYLQHNPESRLRLHGFTDGKGGQAYNIKLSQRRAEAVALFLHQTYNIPAQRMAVVPHGVDLQTAGPGSYGGTRRVEFEFF